MDGSATLTIRLPAKVKKRLGRLAETTDRTKSWLAAAAISDYVAREEALATDLKKRLEEVRSGKAKLIPHDEVMAEMRAMINRVAARSKR